MTDRPCLARSRCTSQTFSSTFPCAPLIRAQGMTLYNYDAIITTFPAATESDLLRLRSSNPSVVDCPALSGMLLSVDSSIVQQREKKSNTYTRVKLSYLDLDWRRASIIGQASSLHLTYGPRLDSHTASMTSSNAIHLTRLNSAFSPSKPASIYNMFCFCFFQHGTI